MRPRTQSAAAAHRNTDMSGNRPAHADRRTAELDTGEPRAVPTSSLPSSPKPSQNGTAPSNGTTTPPPFGPSSGRHTHDVRFGSTSPSPRHATEEDEAMPQLTPGITEHMLQVDDGDDDDDGNESIYAPSRYPDMLSRYRSERFDAMTINSSSRSLYVDDLDYNFENGRRYCGDYFFPNDDLEQDRLRVAHQVFLNVFNFQLTTVPLDNPQYILDVGTGTGEWAISIGEQYPSCEVVGVDISAIQPTAVPHNVFFEVDDCEIEWMRPNDTVDLVHLREMAGAIADWDFVYRQAFACLKPGGFIEVIDFHDHASGPTSFFNCFPPDAQIHVVAQALLEASTRAGRRRGTFHMDPDMFQRAGFVNINVSEHSIPIDPLNNSVGKLWLISCLHMVEASALRLLTRYLDWEPARVLELCDHVCDEIKTHALSTNPENIIKVYLRVVTAQKPGPGTEEPRSTVDVPYRNGHSAPEDESGDESTIHA